MSGSECLQYMETVCTMMPDLILLDLMMPGIDGFDVVTVLRKKYTNETLPIIMVSAKNQASSVVKGLELGCNDWIHKPFDRTELIARVKTHLKARDVMLEVSFNSSLGALAQVKESSTQKPEPAPPPPEETIEPVTGPVDTTIVYVSIRIAFDVKNTEFLSRVFREFEALSHKHKMLRTEILGSCYLAVSENKDDDSPHTDTMLMLALEMKDALTQLIQNQASKIQYRIGIHSDSHEPPVVQGKVIRQYPASCFFSSTVSAVKQMSEGLKRGHVAISRAARHRLSPAGEKLIRNRGLQMTCSTSNSKGVSAHEAHAEIYRLVQASTGLDSDEEEEKEDLDEAAKRTAVTTKVAEREVAQQAPPPAVQCAMPPPVQEHLQEYLLSAQQELQSVQRLLASSQTKLQNKEEQLMNLQVEFHHSQVQNQKLAAAQQNYMKERETPQAQELPAQSASQFMSTAVSGARVVNQAASGTLLFLQWQNAHLHAEVRHLQQTLGGARAELQSQAMHSQINEKKHALLMERVEHLELDLGFRNTCGMLPTRNFAPMDGLGMGGGIPHEVQAARMHGGIPSSLPMSCFPGHLMTKSDT